MRRRHAEGVPAAEGNGGSQPASWRTRASRLWFATIGGLAGIDPMAAARTDPRPVARIEHALIDGGEVDQGSALPRGIRRIEFEYTALLLTSPQQVRFRYRLEPVDTEWSEAGARPSVTNTHLSHGAYSFRVDAAGRDGVFAEDPSPFEFEVTPFFYERPLFRFGLAVLGLALLIGLGALRTRGLRRRGLELERIVAEKTRDLERLASEDPLTGLANRRQFDRELENDSIAFPQRQIAVLLQQLRMMLPPEAALWAGGAGIRRLAKLDGIDFLPTVNLALAALADWRATHS